MTLVLYWFPTSKEEWLSEVIEKYEKKINFYFPFKIEPLKPKKLSREEAHIKIKHEEKVVLDKIKPTDFVIAFDEAGKLAADSVKFSQQLVRAIESSKKRVVFIIGGAFGLGGEVKKRSDLTLSLSSLTFSHQIVLAVALEQLYRSLTIYKNHPYHNL